jgi:hypothetical protein
VTPPTATARERSDYKIENAEEKLFSRFGDCRDVLSALVLKRHASKDEAWRDEYCLNPQMK